jgi:cytochrome c oxidase subunit I+III
MTLSRMPVYAWAMLVVGMMIVFAFPAIIAGTTLLEMERAFNWPIFDAERGGDPLLWQHLFWFFGHPEVYIIFLPAAGMVSAMVPALTGTPLVGHRAIIAALLATAFFSFALWSHHMFTAGLGSLSMSLVSAASLAVAVPTSIQVFAWIATLWRGRVQANTPTLFILGFLFTFVLGGLTGVMVAILPFDWQAHDSYFIVAHLHYVLIGGLLFPVFAALYYWFPLVNGHRLSEAQGRWVAGLTVGGFQLTFFPMHFAGLMGMPRRVYTYDAGLGWEWPNLLSSLGSAVLALGIALLAIDVVRTCLRPRQAPGDPWRSPTLEWLPAGNYNTRSIPQVRSRHPLWDQPALADKVVQGRHWLPGNATGQRETLVTTPRQAIPSHVVLLPGFSWLPLLGALGTAGFFLLLTAKWVLPAAAFGVLAVGSVVAWLWGSDRLPKATSAEVATDIMLPIGHVGRRSHSFWATVILLLVDMTVLASMAFAHLHVSMLGDVCPPPGAHMPGWQALALPCALFGLSAGLLMAGGRQRAQAPLGRGRAGWILAATAAAWLAFALGWQAYQDAGLAPTARAWDATIGAMLSYVGFHMAVLLICGLYLVARIWAGLCTPRQRATLDNICVLWLGATVQGVAVLMLPLAAARVM